MYKPAASGTLQLVDIDYNAAADAAAGVGTPSTIAAATSNKEHLSYQQLKEVCVTVDKYVKDIYQFCLAQRSEGHLEEDIINNTQQELCDDIRELEQLAQPLLAEMLRNSNIEQAVTIEFLRDAPMMQRAAAKKFQQLIMLINSNKKQKKASDTEQHQNA